MKATIVALIACHLFVLILGKKRPIVINTWHFQSAGEKGTPIDLSAYFIHFFSIPLIAFPLCSVNCVYVCI